MIWKSALLVVALLIAACSQSSDPQSAVLTATAAEIETAVSGADLDEGSTYRYSFFIHCGTEWLGEFNGVVWRTESPIYDGIGRFPDYMQPFLVDPQNTISSELWTIITMKTADEIVLQLPDGSKTSTYHPTDEEWPGCA